MPVQPICVINHTQPAVPAFMVGGVPVFGRAVLAPMAGYSDVPYRAVCRAYGSAMHYTEFVAVEYLQSDRPNGHWRYLDRRPGDNPMVFQIFGNHARKILHAAQRIEQWGPDIIDINMGCSTRRVSGRGAGVGMMRDPALVAETFSLLTRNLKVPVTAKIRLGWDDLRNYLEIGQILEDNGAALIAIHPRTKEQKYGGRAAWDPIATLKASVGVPVIGNGDVTDPAQIQQMLDETGCDAVMVGRGAIGNPWIFAGKRRDELPFAEIAAAIRLHLQEVVAYHGEKHGVRRFRKHLARYLDDTEPLGPLVARMMTESSAATVERMVDQAEAVMAAAPTGQRWPRSTSRLTARSKA